MTREFLTFLRSCYVVSQISKLVCDIVSSLSGVSYVVNSNRQNVFFLLCQLTFNFFVGTPIRFNNSLVRTGKKR